MNAPEASRPTSTARIVGMILLGTLLMLVLALLAPWAWQQWRGEAQEAAGSRISRLPWVVKVLDPAHSEVLGLQLVSATAAGTGTSLEEASAAWPQEVLEIAVVQSPGGTRTLEAFLASISLNGLQGKLVFTAAATAEELQVWADRAIRSDPQESGARRLSLAGPDAQQARRHRIDGVVFLPSARLDEDVLVQRLGTPAERISEALPPKAPSDTPPVVHLMYPDKGLAVAVDGRGKNRVVLQYVPPADFETRLRAPLRARAHTPPAQASAAPAAR